MNTQKTIFLAILASLGVISASLCASALPFIADHFAASFSSVQFTISLFLTGNGLGQFFSGPLSDRFGQKKVMLCGLFLYFVASLGTACAQNMPFLIMFRFFQGMGSAVGPVLARAIAASHTRGARAAQVQSYGAMGIGVASIFSILCSGQLMFVSWRANFVLAAVLGLFLFSWAFFWKEGEGEGEGEGIQERKGADYKFFREMKRVCKEGHFVRALLCHSLTYGLMYAYITLFPFLLMELFAEKNPGSVSFYSALMIVCYMCGAYGAARLVASMTKERLILLGIVLQLGSGVLFLVSHGPVLLFTALTLFNVGIGIILPMTIAIALAPFAQGSAGIASSLFGTGYRLIGSFVSMSICLLPYAKCMTLGVAICALSLCALVLVYRKSERLFLKAIKES